MKKKSTCKNKDFERLWAPWRVTYITSVHKKIKGCVFCGIFKSRGDRGNYVFLRSGHCYAVLNIYPYNNGHVLIVPNRHVNSLKKLNKEERLDLLETVDQVTELLEKTLNPAGFNIGINFGRPSGAGFPGHLHVHIVPRWNGDANFMPVIAKTKVISQSLSALHRILSDAFQDRI